jgi:uncharacterized protein
VFWVKYVLAALLPLLPGPRLNKFSRIKGVTMIKIPASSLINKPGRSREQLYVIMTTAVSDHERMQKYRADHLDYLHDLDSKGLLVGAGPLLSQDAALYEGDGLIIIRADSLPEALGIAESDPFHQHNVRDHTLKPWLLSEGDMVSMPM